MKLKVPIKYHNLKDALRSITMPFSYYKGISESEGYEALKKKKQKTQF